MPMFNCSWNGVTIRLSNCRASGPCRRAINRSIWKPNSGIVNNSGRLSRYARA